MSDDEANKADHGDKINDEKTDNEAKETKDKTRSVSFNRDVHVKRFGKPRESRGASETPSIRKEPFTHLSEQELIEEANKVLAQAKSVTCTADNPPEKFFSLPHRRKFSEKSGRRNSDDTIPEKTPLGRSTSDVTSKKRKERTSLSTLFRRAQRTRSPEAPVVVATKPVAVVKRSKSDVTDLKSNTNLNKTNNIRKRSGSETEEFLKSLRNKKTQLSPIIESSPREDYFKNTPPLEVYQKQKAEKESKIEDQIKKVNPVEKPPRYKAIDSEPKPPTRVKRGKSQEKEKSPITETPKRKTEVKKTVLVDEIDSHNKENLEVKDKIKESIRKIEENVYGSKEMIHSSQQPPDKPPLTRGNTVDHLVQIIKDQQAPPPKSHLIIAPNGTNSNQPFSYIKPSVSPDPNLFVKTSPDRVPSPVNKMNHNRGIVYAQVVRDVNSSRYKQNIPKTYSKDKYGNISDEDEGLGYDDRHKASNIYDYDYKNDESGNFNSLDDYKPESPIRPKTKVYKIPSFENLEPIYANEDNPDLIDKFRGRADGMDTKRKQYEPENNKIDLNFNELSHRRQLLESRINARRFDRERVVDDTVTRYLKDDPIYEAERRMKATEKFVNETVRYCRNTIERDGYTESSITEDYSKYDNDKHKIKYNTETRTYQKVPKGELDRREFIDSRYRDNRKDFPPEPEYEPPSLEFNIRKPVLTPDEYKEKKYKARKILTSSQDLLHASQRYKKDEWSGKRKGHYASNPEIAQEREEEYVNLPRYPDTYHNSLHRGKNKDRYKESFAIRRHDSGDSRDYYREETPRRYEIDNRLVDSGIENDFRKDSNNDIHRSKHRRHESIDDVRDTSMFLASERQHTEDNYPGEKIYANSEYLARVKEYRNKRDYRYKREYRDERDYRKEYDQRDRSAEEPHFEKIASCDKSPSRVEDKVSAKPPKAKKLSGLEKMKQLFSRDSSKKSKKEKEPVQPKPRTRVLKSPEHLARDDSDYRRYTDPEPSDIVVRKVNNECLADERRYRSSKEELDRYRNSREDLERYRSPEPRDSDLERERKYRRSKEPEFNMRYDRTLKEERRYKDRHEEKRRYHSSDRESDHHSRPSDGESDIRKSRSRTAGPMDSPALAERYRERRRLATPSPTPSPPRRPPTSSSQNGGTWFKSLDRLTRKKGKSPKIEKESPEDERKPWSKPTKTLNSPAKNLRFFGDTDQDSDATPKHNNVTKSKSHPTTKYHGMLRKTISNSSTGLDEVDHSELSNKSYSLSNLHKERDRGRDSPRRTFKRNLQNISEIQSNSEKELHGERKMATKPPISPYERSSRSHSSSKTLKGSKTELGRRTEERSSSEMRGSKQELNRDLKNRRRTPVTNSGESSTEGDSSHQSQRSVVYLHATTVGAIPDPGRLVRNRSRDDVSSVNSSNLQVRSTTKSFSIFAPWTPKHYNDTHDVHYAQKPRKTRETMKKAASTKTLTDDRPATLQKNKSYSQTTLTRRPQSSQLSNSSTTYNNKKPEKRTRENQQTLRKSMGRDGKKSQSTEVINRDLEKERLSRTLSVKDNNKKAGWFKMSSKNKKPELNTRVR